jgi:hypothetical protein
VISDSEVIASLNPGDCWRDLVSVALVGVKHRVGERYSLLDQLPLSHRVRTGGQPLGK